MRLPSLRDAGVIHRFTPWADPGLFSGLDRIRRRGRPPDTTGDIVNREQNKSVNTRSTARARAAAAGVAALILGGLLVGCGQSAAEQDPSPTESASSPASETSTSTPGPTTSPTRLSNPDHDNLDPRGPLPGSTAWEQMKKADQR